MKNENINITYGAITVDHVEPSRFDSNKFQAQIRQTVTRTYKQKGSDSLSGALFNANEFGDGEAFAEIRVTWLPVPAEKATKEAVEAQLVKFPNAQIMRFLGLKPILSDEQLRSMESGVNTKSIEQYANDQAIPGVNYKGYAVCRVVKFVTSKVADIDNRETDYIAETGDVSEQASTFEMGTKVAATVNASAEKF